MENYTFLVMSASDMVYLTMGLRMSERSCNLIRQRLRSTEIPMRIPNIIVVDPIM